MFEVGFTELLLIAALALLVLGPQKLPKLAQQVGRWVGRARAMARQFRDQLEEEAHTIETKMSIDPGIDTSLDGKRHTDPRPSDPTPPPDATAAQDQDKASTPPPETEEDFYPPDHHMHPANRAPEQSDQEQSDDEQPPSDEAAPAGAQGELDLTTSGQTTS